MPQGAGKLGKNKNSGFALRKGHSHAKKKKKNLKMKDKLDAWTNRKIETQLLAGLQEVPDGSLMHVLHPDKKFIQQMKTETAQSKQKSCKKKNKRR